MTSDLLSLKATRVAANWTGSFKEGSSRWEWIEDAIQIATLQVKRGCRVVSRPEMRLTGFVRYDFQERLSCI